MRLYEFALRKNAVSFMSIYWTHQGIGLVKVKSGLILLVALHCFSALAQPTPPQDVKQKSVPAEHLAVQPLKAVPKNPSPAPEAKSIAPPSGEKTETSKPAQPPAALAPLAIAPMPATPLPPLPPIDTTKPPPMLPRASREQMHVCADQWRELKMSSTQDLPMWRHFAARCLKQEPKAQTDK